MKYSMKFAGILNETGPTLNENAFHSFVVDKQIFLWQLPQLHRCNWQLLVSCTFHSGPPVNDTGNQEVEQTQVKYGPPKKKTPAIRAPANDAATQEVGQTQVKYGPPKKKTVAAAVEGQRRPSNAKVFDGVHIQAREQPSR